MAGTGVVLVAVAGATLVWRAVASAVVVACIAVALVAAGVAAILDVSLFVPLALVESVVLKRLVWAPAP